MKVEAKLSRGTEGLIWGGNEKREDGGVREYAHCTKYVCMKVSIFKMVQCYA